MPSAELPPPPPPALDVFRPPSPSFYKRPLPEICIPFASDRGKQLFGKALNEGNLDSYFKLASQFLTQNEPAYCGIGTLTMLLNSLEVDPQRKWKGPWRWFEQEMLDCCRPLSSIAQVGITLSEFACLARCNGLKASVASPATEKEVTGLEKFKKDLKIATANGGDTMMAISYSRSSLGQSGDGHFSPVGGYSEEDQMVLILDVARFKYPPYWVSVKQAWESMKPLDKQTNQPRGYALVSLLPTSDPSSLLAPPSLTTLSLNKSSWATLSTSISAQLLRTPSSTSLSTLLQSLHSQFSSRPVPILNPRPPSPLSSSPDLSLQLLLSTLPSSNPNQLPMNTLFILALFSPTKTSPMLRLVPSELREELKEFVEESLERGGKELRDEVRVIGGQVGALGECCKAEEGTGGSCGCSMGA